MGHRARRAWWAVAVFGLVLGLGDRSQAGIIYDNLGAASVNVYQVAGRSIALSFTTGSGRSILDDVTLKLTRFNNPLGSITVSLLADSTQSPGGVLATIGTLADSAVAATGFSPLDYRVAITGSYVLEANTRYWLQLSSNDGSQIAWSQAQHPGGTGTGGQYTAFATSGGVPTITPIGFSNTPTQMRLSVADAPPVIMNPSVVPEPSSLALCLAGTAVGLAHAARKRRRGA